jgi:hypothetical protein
MTRQAYGFPCRSDLTPGVAIFTYSLQFLDRAFTISAYRLLMGKERRLDRRFAPSTKIGQPRQGPKRQAKELVRIIKNLKEFSAFLQVWIEAMKSDAVTAPTQLLVS